MAVKIGSARIDEHGGSGLAGNAKAGDQTKREVSTQDWYLHSKGWVVIRAKDATTREKIAYAMQRACDNNNIGYDQSQRLTAQQWCEKHGNYDPGAITSPVETDCSALVRLCCAYAGIKVGNFNTSNEVSVLKATGKFDVLTDSKYTTSSNYSLRGDILVTKTQGHTVVVLSNGSKVSSTTSTSTPAPTSFAIVGTGTAKTDMNVRTGGSTNNSIIGLVKKGEKVQIIEQLSSGWLKIVWNKASNGYAYVSNKSNAYFTISSEFPYTVQVTADSLYIRKGPGTNYAIAGVVHKNEKYTIVAIENEKWAKLQNGKGYISRKYVKKV